MTNIGKPAPRFRAPALIDGRLAYLSSTQFAGRWTALCFLPYVALVETAFLNHQADTFEQIDTALVIVSSGARPLHRLWIDCPTKPHAPVLADPLGRLHRSFGVTVAQMPLRCQTFLIDRDGILRFHLIHEFNERGLAAVKEIPTMSQDQAFEWALPNYSEDKMHAVATTAPSQVAVGEPTSPHDERLANDD